MSGDLILIVFVLITAILAVLVAKLASLSQSWRLSAVALLPIHGISAVRWIMPTAMRNTVNGAVPIHR